MSFCLESAIPGPKIGALVGMGPNSTGLFYNQLIQYSRTILEAKADDDFPEIILISLPTPFRVSGPIDHDKMKAQLLYGVEKMKSLGADYVVIPCNIIHQYFDELGLNELHSPPIMHIVDITLNALKVTPKKPTALLATESTINSNIYQKKLGESGYTLIHSDEIQAKVNALLTELKKTSTPSQAALNLWSDILSGLIEAGCKNVIIACTDITPCLKSTPDTSLTFFDSANLLAKASIERYKKLKEAKL